MVPCDLDEPPQALGLRARDVSTGAGDPVVAPAFVVERRVGSGRRSDSSIQPRASMRLIALYNVPGPIRTSPALMASTLCMMP